jgi:hypothetical protein
MSDGRIHTAGEDQVVVYTDATYEYICEANPAAELTDTVWRVRRSKLDGSRIEWAAKSCAYKYAATDLATVQALFA